MGGGVAEGPTAVEGDPEDGCVVVADELGVLDVGRLHEGVDPGEVRELRRRGSAVAGGWALHARALGTGREGKGRGTAMDRGVSASVCRS